ncbi:MAG: hypothetical protein HWE22_00895 [Flavobacteriales bacterium]|nr:hypothetical protein [Flavobacteriales bacterium]
MITEEQALQIAEKILKDIDFWSDDVINPKAQLIDGDRLSKHEEPYMLASYNYAEEDFGYGNAYVSIILNPSTGEARNKVITRSGSIRIKYDEQKDKYLREK